LNSGLNNAIAINPQTDFTDFIDYIGNDCRFGRTEHRYVN
jgi:hypothetical protein